MNDRFSSSAAVKLVSVGIALLFGVGCGEAFSASGATGSGGTTAATAGAGGAPSVSATAGNGGSPTTSTSVTTTSVSTSSATSGSSGASGSSATSSSGSGITTASSSGSGSTGCAWNALSNPCATNQYCDDPTCGTAIAGGICKLKAAPLQTGDNPVCGCDGITYWNGKLAAEHGVPRRSMGMCTSIARVMCDALDVCPFGTNCVTINNSKGCDGVAPGACWALPNDCGTTQAQAQGCGSGQCDNACVMMKTAVTITKYCP